MTKRLLATVLALAMIIGMLVIPANAAETDDQTKQAGYCQHCKTVIPEEQWLPWDVTNLGPRTGHYYLAGDINDQAKQITINLDDDLYRNVICLDLRGRSYSVEKFRPFLIYGIFSIMDSVGGGEISTTGQTGNANGAFCQMSKKTGCVDGAGELNIYGGTIRRVNTDTEIVAYGGLIYAGNGATVNLYGGKLVGGDVHARFNSSGNAVSPLGGTIFATAANVNIYGGTVTGGVANDTTLTLSDGTTKSYDAYGGNIYAEKSSVVTIAGGTVENGYSDTYGGNLCIKESDLIITGGTVTGGYSEGAAGNIQITSGGSFKMSGGTLKNGVCTTRGGNLFVDNKNIDIEITGGEIYGDLSIGVFKSLVLSGAPKIYMGLGNGLHLQSTNETKMDISGLTEGAVVYLDGVDQVFTEVLENPETYLTYFKDAIRADITVDETGALAVAQGTTGFCPHCWESGEQAEWTAWHNKSSTSTSLLAETGSAHYYLTATTTRKGIIGIGNSSTTTNDIVFDAAGKTWTTTNKKLFNLYGTVSLMDSVGSGKFTSTGHAEANGGAIMGTSTGIFNMYSGTLSRTVSDGEEMKGVYIGGVLYAPSGSSTNVYGGTIRDGISASVSTKKNNCNGGNIYAGGSFTMTAGAVIGGQAYTNSYIEQNTESPITNSSGSAITLSGQGGNLYLAGVATISGGHIVDGNATYGGNIFFTSGSTPSIAGGVIRGGVADATNGVVDATVNLAMYGGNIYVAGSSSNRQELAIENAILRSGSAKEFGGNLYATITDLTLENSIITDGTAGLASGDDGRGGNLYLTGSVVANMYDTTIGNGYALAHGGNLYAPGGIAFHMHSGLVTGGEATTYGGNMYCNGFNMYSGIVTGGKTTSLNGGNIFVYEGEANYLNIEAAANAPAPIVSNGSGGSLGGNIYLGKNTTGTITGAIIENGNGDTAGKSSGFNADNVYANVGTTLTLADTTILDIVSDSNYGNGVYAGGELILKGATVVTNEEKDSCIYIASDGKLTVDAGFTGEASVAFEDAHFENPDEPQGGTLAEQNTAIGVFTGTLLLEGYLDRDYGLPAIFAEADDTKLYVATTAVISGGEISWYRDATSAAAAIPQNGYLRLFASNNTIEMTDDLTVDMNGKNLTVTGTGTVYGFDTANDDYTTYGTITVPEGVEVASAYQAPGGNYYVTVTNENGTSFHRLGIRVSAVSVRPSLAGIYYNGIWECDDALKAKIKSFGVAVSTFDMPTAASLGELDTICTAHGADEFVSGTEKTSVMISNILKSGADNNDRGTREIYTALYAVVDDGSEKGLVIMGDDNQHEADGVTYTLKSVLQAVDRIWPKLTERQQASVKAMYAIDADALSTWNLYNITAAINGTASIRPLKILTLGHSLAVDSGHMLNLVADAEGYNQPLEIATLYYSGCPLYKHVNYIKNNSAVYDLYVSSTTTPEKPPVITKGVTMKYALEYDYWDIIIMQGGVFEIAYDEKYTDGNIQFIQNYVNQHKQNPDAIFAWHMPWATPTDTTLRDMYPYSPNSYYTSYAAFNDDRSQFYGAITDCVGKYIVTDPSFIYLIPSGTAIENALSSYLEETDLHRDYAHVTDLGRVISSYTWYCTLAGVDHLDEIKVDAIPKAFLKSTADKTQDRVLTEAEKAIILEAVNNALKDPLHMTQSVYTTAP